MMPVQRRSQESRERIVAAASAAFRRDGYAATGVDRVMSDAGLTHGGFYAHFASKRDLLQAAIGHTAGNQLFQRVAHLQGEDFIGASITEYLSMWHRDHPACGCPLPTLGAELPRLDAGLGDMMGGPLQRLAERIRQELPTPDGTRQARAAALLALLVGGVITARTLPDAAASVWLANCRLAARCLAGLTSESP